MNSDNENDKKSRNCGASCNVKFYFILSKRISILQKEKGNNNIKWKGLLACQPARLPSTSIATKSLDTFLCVHYTTINTCKIIIIVSSALDSWRNGEGTKTSTSTTKTTQNRFWLTFGLSAFFATSLENCHRPCRFYNPFVLLHLSLWMYMCVC